MNSKNVGFFWKTKLNFRIPLQIIMANEYLNQDSQSLDQNFAILASRIEISRILNPPPSTGKCSEVQMTATINFNLSQKYLTFNKNSISKLILIFVMNFLVQMHY